MRSYTIFNTPRESARSLSYSKRVGKPKTREKWSFFNILHIFKTYIFRMTNTQKGHNHTPGYPFWATFRFNNEAVCNIKPYKIEKQFTKWLTVWHKCCKTAHFPLTHPQQIGKMSIRWRIFYICPPPHRKNTWVVAGAAQIWPSSRQNTTPLTSGRLINSPGLEDTVSILQ